MNQGARRVEIHLHIDLFHLLRVDNLARKQLQGSIQSQMSAAAAGVFLDLDTRFDHIEFAAQGIEHHLRVEPLTSGKGAHKSEAAFDSIAAGGKALPDQTGCRDSGASSLSGVEGLGHGAEVLTQAGGLGGCQRDGHSGLLPVQVQESGGRGSGSNGAQGPGGVPSQIVEVLRAQACAHAAGNFKSNQIG